MKESNTELLPRFQSKPDMATDRRKTRGRSGMHRNIPLPPRLYAIRDTGTECDTTARREAVAKATGVNRSTGAAGISIPAGWD